MARQDSRWTTSEAVPAGGFSNPVFFPRRIDEATVRIKPGVGGTATVYFTLDNEDDVRDDPDNAEWDEWEPGSVSVATSRALAGPVVAVRAAAVTEDAVLQVAGSRDY